MRLITRHYLASIAAQVWKEMYSNNGRWHIYPTDKETREKTYKKLLELGPAPDPEEVDRIVSKALGRKNTSWTDRGSCHECAGEGVDLIELGEEPDRESSTARICLVCLVKALELIDS